MVDLGPVLRTSLIMDKEVRTGIDVVGGMQRDAEDILTSFNIEGRYSLGTNDIDLEGRAGLVGPCDDGRGRVCADSQNVGS